MGLKDTKPERKVLKAQLLRKKAKLKANPAIKEAQRQRAADTKGKKGANLNRYYR